MVSRHHEKKSTVSFILLAPTSVIGGVTTWTRFFLSCCDRDRMDPRVIDTAKKYEEIGKARNFRGTLLGILQSLKIMFDIIRIYFGHRPKLVYATCSGFWSFFTRDLVYAWLARILGMKVILHLRAGNIPSYFGGTPVTRLLSRMVMTGADRIVVLSRDMEARVRERYAHKVVYLPNMIGEEIFEKVAPKLCCTDRVGVKVLQMSFQSPLKGSYDIIEAFRILMKGSHSGLTCDLVGKGAPEHEAVIMEKIREYGLEGIVRLNPETSGAEKWKYFNEADIFLFPSHTEGFPNVLLEAMCFGLPIIATNVGNIREMIGWNTPEPAGLLLENLNPVSSDELARLLLRLVENPGLRQSLGANGQRRVRSNYMTGIVIPQIERLILSAAEGS